MKNGNSPYTFVMSDYDKLRKSGEQYLFARKFDEYVDFQIVERLSLKKKRDSSMS